MRPTPSRPGNAAPPSCALGAIDSPRMGRPAMPRAATPKRGGRGPTRRVGIAEERMARADRDLAGLDERVRTLAAERGSVRIELADATAAEAAARDALAATHAADAAERDRLAAAEREAAGTRERLRATDERLRIADRDDLEARLGLESLREAVLVELAGLGELGDRAPGGGSRHGRRRSADPGARHRSDRGSGAVHRTRTPSKWRSRASSRRRWIAPRPSGPRRRRPTRHRARSGSASSGVASTSSARRTRSRSRSTPSCASASRRSKRRGRTCGRRSPRTRELIAELESMITDQFQTTFRALEARLRGAASSSSSAAGSPACR